MHSIFVFMISGESRGYLYFTPAGLTGIRGPAKGHPGVSVRAQVSSTACTSGAVDVCSSFETLYKPMDRTELASASHSSPPALSVRLGIRLVEILTLLCVGYAAAGTLFTLSEPHMTALMIKSDDVCEVPGTGSALGDPTTELAGHGCHIPHIILCPSFQGGSVIGISNHGIPALPVQHVCPSEPFHTHPGASDQQHSQAS